MCLGSIAPSWRGNNCLCHRVTASSDTLPFSRFSGICIYRNIWILLPENTKQLYSLAHVIISLDRGATRFTLFSNTETLSFTESIGKSWLVSNILHIYIFQFSKIVSLFRFTIVAIAWCSSGTNLGKQIQLCFDMICDCLLYIGESSECQLYPLLTFHVWHWQARARLTQCDTMWHITIIAACIPRPLIGGCHHLPPPIAHKTSTNNGVGDRITQRNVGTIMDSGGNEAVLTIDCCLFALIVWVWHRLIDTSHYNDTREQDIRRR